MSTKAEIWFKITCPRRYLRACNLFMAPFLDAYLDGHRSLEVLIVGIEGAEKIDVFGTGLPGPHDYEELRSGLHEIVERYVPVEVREWKSSNEFKTPVPTALPNWRPPKTH